MTKTKEVIIDLGALKAEAVRAAKAHGLSLEEFTQNAIEQKVNTHSSHHPRHEYVRHGGKHLMGKSTGYEVTKDGRYYPARTWTDHFETLFAERQAAYSLMQIVTRESQSQLAVLEKSIIQTKQRLIDDLGLDGSLNWVYYGEEKCLRVVAKEAEEE